MKKKSLLTRYYGIQPQDTPINTKYQHHNYSTKSLYPETSSPLFHSHKITSKYAVDSPTVSSKSYQIEKQWKPNNKGFLRHTIYLNKGQSFMDSEKDPLYQSQAQKIRKKSSDLEINKSSSFSTSSCEDFDKNLKNFKYISFQPRNAQTKKGKREVCYTEGSVNDKYQFVQGQKTSANQKKPLFPSQVSDANLNFRKKVFKQDFYTPKPQTSQVFIPQKNKRIFSPEYQFPKIVSPSYKKNLNITIKDFIIDGRLGGGKFGTVHKAIHIKTNSIYALKKIPKSILKENMMIDQFILEFKIQSFMKHENIVQVYGMFDEDEHIYLILEYLPDGTLYSLLKKKKALSEKEVAYKIKQIAQAIVYMHGEGIVHRDIKPENIVLAGKVCKLCDFGWANICDERRKTYCGTFDYVAPQIFEGAEYDMTVDLWCLGVITYQLIFGKAPFYHISRKETVSNILNVEWKKIKYPSTISNEGKSFIESLLRKNPEQRLSYEEVLNHPFLSNVHDQE